MAFPQPAGSEQQNVFSCINPVCRFTELPELSSILSWLTWPMSVGKWTLEGIETRAQLLDSDGLLRQSSDPYIMVREAYFQRHDFIANGGELKPQENPNAQAIQDDLKDIDSE